MLKQDLIFNKHKNYFLCCFHLNKKAEFIMTTTDPALCTNAPTTGFNIPVIANKIARKLSPKEKIKLHLIVIIILFDSEIK